MSYLDKCTKGEWVAEYDGDYETSILVRGEENFCLASVHGCNVEEINSAHLMAASKDMYRVIEDIIHAFEHTGFDFYNKDGMNILDNAKLTLKKARGEK